VVEVRRFGAYRQDPPIPGMLRIRIYIEIRQVLRMASQKRRETKQKRMQRIVSAIIAIILVLGMIVTAVLAGT